MPYGLRRGSQRVPKGRPEGFKKVVRRGPKGVPEALKRVSERWVSWGIIGLAGFGYDLGRVRQLGGHGYIILLPSVLQYVGW